MRLTVQKHPNNNGVDVEFESIKMQSAMDTLDAYEELKRKHGDDTEGETFGYLKLFEIDNLDIKMFYAVELATDDRIIITLLM